MAEADEADWEENVHGDLDENLILGSEMMVNDDHFDQDSASSATSYTASVTNSPMTEAHRRADPHLEQ